MTDRIKERIRSAFKPYRKSQTETPQSRDNAQHEEASGSLPISALPADEAKRAVSPTRPELGDLLNSQIGHTMAQPTPHMPSTTLPTAENSETLSIATPFGRASSDTLAIETPLATAISLATTTPLTTATTLASAITATEATATQTTATPLANRITDTLETAITDTKTLVITAAEATTTEAAATAITEPSLTPTKETATLSAIIPPLIPRSPYNLAAFSLKCQGSHTCHREDELPNYTGMKFANEPKQLGIPHHSQEAVRGEKKIQIREEPDGALQERYHQQTVQSQHSDNDLDFFELTGRSTIPRAGSSGASKQMTSSTLDNSKWSKLLSHVKGKRQSPSPFELHGIEDTSFDSIDASPSPPAMYKEEEREQGTKTNRNADEETKENGDESKENEDEGDEGEENEGDDEDEENDDDDEKGRDDEKDGDEEKEGNDLIGKDGLLNVFALRQDLNRRCSGLNKRFKKYRTRQDTIRRLLRSIQHMIREKDELNSLLSQSSDQINVLTKKASDMRFELADLCDETVTSVGFHCEQMSKLEPTCYNRYVNIKSTTDCTNLLTTIRKKKKVLDDLEILIHRKRLVNQNALPVSVDDTPCSKIRSQSNKKLFKIVSRQGSKGSKLSKMMPGKKEGFKPIVLEISSHLDESGSNTQVTDTPMTPASSDCPISSTTDDMTSKLSTSRRQFQ